ncbi:MAG: phosphatase PAP2 family protein [Gemmatimonadales bacterium]|nr:phosphatase PAP2 family protein [Gemmatimonadales bacterium]
MHVAATVIMALGSWERSRWLGMVGWLYVLVILVGSVHLNWHYAIDGYVAILGTLAIWWLSAWVVRRYA